MALTRIRVMLSYPVADRPQFLEYESRIQRKTKKPLSLPLIPILRWGSLALFVTFGFHSLGLKYRASDEVYFTAMLALYAFAGFVSSFIHERSVPSPFKRIAFLVILFVSPVVMAILQRPLNDWTEEPFSSKNSWPYFCASFFVLALVLRVFRRRQKKLKSV